MPELARENDNVFALMKMCVTSLVHYDGYLKEHLHENSMVRTPNFFTITIPLADFVTTKYLWSGTDDTSRIIGIPPEIMLLAEMESMKKEILELKSSLPDSFRETSKKELDDRQVGGAGYVQSTEIITKLDRVLAWIDA